MRRLYRGVRLDGPATALIVTAAAGDIEAAEYLLHVYADVNATDANGNTPLHAAVAASELEVVSLLLKHGADVNAAAGNKRTPLIRATAYGDESIAIELINAGTNVNLGTERNLTPLMYAAMNGQTELCRLLLQNGAKVDASENDFGWTAHIHATRHGQVEVMQVLENAGADPRQKDNRGADSLYHAALNSGIVLNSLKYLLSQGADPNTATSNGATPLHEAARVGPADAVILLYEAGGSLEVSNNRGETPLDVLRNRNDEEAKRALEVLARHPVEKR